MAHGGSGTGSKRRTSKTGSVALPLEFKLSLKGLKMSFSMSPNWAEWARIAKSIGGFTTAAGVGLGALSPAVAPLAVLVPSLAPLAGVIAAVGLLLHGIATGTKALAEAVAPK